MSAKPKTIRDWVNKTTESVKETVQTVSNEYKSSAISETINQTASKAKQLLDDTGVTDKASQVSGLMTDGLDTVSGQKVLQLVEQRLALQAQYNDILATKLEEALQRLDALEIALKKSA